MRHVHHDSLHSDQVPDVTDRKERPNRKPQDFPEKLVHFIKDVKKNNQTTTTSGGEELHQGQENTIMTLLLLLVTHTRVNYCCHSYRFSGVND